MIPWLQRYVWFAFVRASLPLCGARRGPLGHFDASSRALILFVFRFAFFYRAGMDFYVVLERPGYRVSRRRKQLSRVGVQHRVTKEDSIKWFQTKFEGVVLNKSSAN